MRLMSRCARAKRLPTSIEAMASTLTSFVQSPAAGAEVTRMTSRARTTAEATFGATERKATNGEGAPW